MWCFVRHIHELKHACMAHQHRAPAYFSIQLSAKDYGLLPTLASQASASSPHVSIHHCGKLHNIWRLRKPTATSIYYWTIALRSAASIYSTTVVCIYQSRKSLYSIQHRHCCAPALCNCHGSCGAQFKSVYNLTAAVLVVGAAAAGRPEQAKGRAQREGQGQDSAAEAPS